MGDAPQSHDARATSVKAFSVADVVAIRLDGDGKQWRLSLVQRAAVWDETKVRYLLDSLLCGYPIGSLLLCSVRAEGNVLVERDGVRIREEAAEGEWQLLDGQQRVNALVQLFSTEGGFEHRFLLCLDEERDLEDVTRRRSSLERSLHYIRPDGTDEPPERWRWLDISGVRAAAGHPSFPSFDSLPLASDEDLLRLASVIDPKCRWEEWVAAPTRDIAAERVRRLLRCWHAASIPVMELHLDGPTDVLQVFNRVNRTGTVVGNDDMFFAAVRTLWLDAEEHVEQLRRRSPLLTRIGALRLLSRIASRRLTDVDILPLDIERLRGDSGGQLVREMERLAHEDSHLLVRLEEISKAAIETSGLGHGLTEISERLFDPVLAWALTRNRPPVGDEHLQPAWAFLLGASAFRYRTVFGDTFERLALEHAMRAAAHDQPFPIAAIAEACREKWEGLKRGRQRIAGVDSEEEKRAFVDGNRGLLLRVVQRVPFEIPEGHAIDIEHLYPVARRSHMKWHGANGEKSRLTFHDGAWDPFRAGNLYVLDASLNRAAGHDWPFQKLPKYREKLWPEELFLSGEEERLLLEAGTHLRAEDVPRGMAAFAAYVRSRELRIFHEIRARFPQAFELAARPDPA